MSSSSPPLDADLVDEVALLVSATYHGDKRYVLDVLMFTERPLSDHVMALVAGVLNLLGTVADRDDVDAELVLVEWLAHYRDWMTS